MQLQIKNRLEALWWCMLKLLSRRESIFTPLSNMGYALGFWMQQHQLYKMSRCLGFSISFLKGIYLTLCVQAISVEAGIIQGCPHIPGPLIPGHCFLSRLHNHWHLLKATRWERRINSHAVPHVCMCAVHLAIWSILYAMFVYGSLAVMPCPSAGFHVTQCGIQTPSQQHMQLFNGN